MNIALCAKRSVLFQYPLASIVELYSLEILFHEYLNELEIPKDQTEGPRSVSTIISLLGRSVGNGTGVVRTLRTGYSELVR